jgi:hypothetical protein
VPQVQKRPRTRFTSRLCSYRPIRYLFGLSTSRYRAVHVIPFCLSRKDIGINSSILLALSCSVSSVPAPVLSLSSLSSSFILPPDPASSPPPPHLRLFAPPDVDAWKCRPSRFLFPRAPPSPSSCFPLSLRTTPSFLAVLAELTLNTGNDSKIST